MPCQYYSDAERFGQAKESLNRMAQNLCFLCGQLTAHKLLGRYASPRILEWWKAHQQHDTERVSGQFEQLFEENENVTAMGAARQFIQRAEAVHPVSEYHKAWFRKLAKQYHEKARHHRDEKRAALSKLTANEKTALGVEDKTGVSE